MVPSRKQELVKREVALAIVHPRCGEKGERSSLSQWYRILTFRRPVGRLAAAEVGGQRLFAVHVLHDFVDEVVLHRFHRGHETVTVRVRFNLRQIMAAMLL